MKMEKQILKFMRCNKSSSRRKLIVINFHIQKKEGPQVNNLTLYLKQEEKEQS